jgi:peptidoglycan/xylan/chitin deacetylase (PgdA/CDA1 family)
MPRSRPPLALTFHGVADVRLQDDPHSLFTSPRLLRQHIRRLRRWGYRFTTFGALADLAREGRADGHVALTFDDGLADNRTTLLPLLREEGVPATVFVATAFIGGRHPDAPHAPMLDADGIRALAEAGVEIGGHSHSHRDLTTVSFDAVRDDLRQCREILTDLAGAPVRVAAYPFGAAREETRQACRAAGFAAAARTAGEGSWSDPYDLPRQDMHNHSGPLGLWLKRDGRYEPLMHRFVGRAVRSVGRRAKAWVR